MSVETNQKNPSSILRWPIVRGNISVFSAENNKLVGRIYNVIIPSEQIKCGINGSTPHKEFLHSVQQVAEKNIAIYSYSPQGQPSEIWIFEAFPAVADLIKQAKECQRQNNSTNIEDTGHLGIFEIPSSSLLTTDPNFIPFFEGKAGKFSDKEIAQYLWLNPETRISDEMVQKVNEVAVYLKTHGFELKGIKADGDCFCNAFLKSYESLSQKIPILDAQENKISYLRDMIALQYSATPKGSTEDDIKRARQIKKNGEWLTAPGEGDLLAKALSIPIRTITVNQDRGRCGINDMLTFPEKNRAQQEWSTIEKSEKPEKYILIVDLGGHFIYAQPSTAEKIGRLSESSLKEDKVKFLTGHEDTILQYEKALKYLKTYKTSQKSKRLSTGEVTLAKAQLKKEIFLLRAKLYLPSEGEIETFSHIINLSIEDENLFKSLSEYLYVANNKSRVDPHLNFLAALIAENNHEYARAIHHYLELARFPNHPNPLPCLKRALSLISKTSDPFALPHFLEKLDYDWMSALLKTNKDPDLERWILQKDAVRMAFEKFLVQLSKQALSGQAPSKPEPTCFICFNVDEPDIGEWLEHTLVPDLDTMGIHPLFCYRDLGPGKVLNNFQELIRTADAAIIACTPDLKRKCVERKGAPTGVALEIELAEGRHGDRDTHGMTFPLYLKGDIHSACPSAICGLFLGSNFTFFENSNASSVFSYYAQVFELFEGIRKTGDRPIARTAKKEFLKEARIILQKDGFDPAEVKKWRQERVSKKAQILKAAKDRVTTSIQVVRLPLPPTNFTGRKQELENLCKDLHEAREKHRRIAITGLGGIGKTALVLAYGDKYKLDYQLVYFIPASTSQMVIQGLLKLADELNLPKGENVEEGLQCLKRTLEQFKQECLLIFDGVDQVEAFHELEKYLPPRGHCLVTSRMPEQSRVQGFNQIPLEPLKADEAVKYLLLATNSAEEKEAEELVEKLGKLPLALTHAAGFIRRQNISIRKYTEEFMRHGVKLFNAKGLSLPKAEKTVLTTWTLSMEIIEKAHNCSIAKDLLDFFAFLGQAPISLELVKIWFKHSYSEYPELEITVLVGDLCEYSMIERPYHNTYTIHPLVQSVARYQLPLENQKNVIVRAFSSLTAQMELLSQEKNATNSGLLKLCIPHAMALFETQNLMTCMSLEAQFEFMKQLGTISLEMGSMPGILEELSRQCLQVAEKWRRETPSSEQAGIAVAWSHNFQGLVLKNLGKAQESLNCFNRALESVRLVHNENHPDIAAAYNSMGLALRDDGKAQESLDAHKKALDIWIRLHHGEKHPHVATCYNNMGLASKDLGRLQESLDYLEKALDIQLALYRENPNHPDIALTNNNMGEVYKDLGKLEKALINYQKALKIYSSLYGEKHIRVAVCNHNLGRALQAIGVQGKNPKDIQKGIDLYQKALQTLIPHYGENHPYVATAYNNIGSAHLAIGEIENPGENKETALGYFRIALNIRFALHQKNLIHPDFAESYNNIGKALGSGPEAIEFFQKAIRIWESLHERGHPHIGIGYINIGEAYEDSKEMEKALKFYIKALNIMQSPCFKNSYEYTHPIMQRIQANISRLGTKDPNLLQKVLCKTPLSIGKPTT